MSKMLMRIISAMLTVMLFMTAFVSAETEGMDNYELYDMQSPSLNEIDQEEDILEVERKSSVSATDRSNFACIRMLNSTSNVFESTGFRVGYYATNPLGAYSWYPVVRIDISTIDTASDEIFFSVGASHARGDFAKWTKEEDWRIDIYGVDMGDSTWSSSLSYGTAFGTGTPFESKGAYTLTSEPIGSFTTESSVPSEGIFGYYGDHSKYRVLRTDVSEYIKGEIAKGNKEIVIMLVLGDHGTIPSNNSTAATFTFNDPRNGASGIWTDLLPTISTVKYKKSLNNDLRSVSVENGIIDGVFDANTISYNVAVVDETKPVKLDYVKFSKYATIGDVVTEGSLDSNKKLMVTVISQAETKKTYEFNLFKADELGYTESGKVKGTEIEYDGDVNTSGKISAMIQNCSISDRDAVFTILELKDNLINKITLENKEVKPGYNKVSFDFNPKVDSDEIAMFIADEENPLIPVSEIVRSGAECDFRNTEENIAIYYKDVSKNGLTVHGKWDVAEADIGAYILNENKTLADFDGTNADEVFVYANAIKSDEEGYYGFDSGVSVGGDYKVYLIDREGNVKEHEFYYASPAEKGEAVEDIYATTTKDELKQLLNLSLSNEEREALEELYDQTSGTEGQKNILKILGISDEGFENQKLEDEFLRLLSININNSSSTEEFNAIFDESLIIAKIGTGVIDDISVYNDKIEISEDIMTIYNDFSDDEKKDVTLKISAADTYDTYGDIKEKAELITVLSSVNNFGNIDRIDGIIAKYADMLQVEDYLSKYNSIKPNSKKKAVIDAVIDNGPYVDVNTFAEVFEKETNKMYKASSTGSSGGGSGSGSGGGRGPAQSIEINNVPQSDLSADKIENKRICKFEDFGGYEWAKDAIVSLYEKNIIDGVSDNAFMPEKEVKREEFLKMANSLYEEKGRVNPLLSDIDTSSWYFDYICKAFSAGIIKGLGDGTFGVGKGMSREDAAVIIVRMLKPAELEEATELFADDSDISDYAKASVYYLKKIGVMSGDDTGSFNPKKSLNRAEAAIIINNIINAE